MSALGDELTRLLTGQAPNDINDLARLFGDTARQQNPAMVREVTGLSAQARLPAKGSAERRRYDALYQSLRRYRSGRRDPGRTEQGRALVRAVRRAAGPRVRALNVGRARREGLKLRLRARYRVSRHWQTSTMPAPTAGDDLWVLVPKGEELDDVLDAWQDGQHDEAEALLEELFFTEYEMPEPAELQYDWVEMRFGDEGGREWFA